METIMPIFYDDTLIAFLQIGQFKDKDGRYSSTEKVINALKGYDITNERILPLYKKVPVVSSEKLQALQSIMDIVIKAFWEDGLIYSNRSMLSVKIEQYIAEHLHEKIYVEELCSRFFLSKNALYRLFNTEFQMTVNEYVFQQRLHLSQKLLKETNQAITKIACDCGFFDYNYFIRLFKRRVGVTPLQFRKSNRIKNNHS